MASLIGIKIFKLFNITRHISQSQCYCSTNVQKMTRMVKHLFGFQNKLDTRVREFQYSDSHFIKGLSFIGFTEGFDYLNYLRLVNVTLTNLEKFPELPNLEMLDLSYNKISGGLNYLSGSPKLTVLNLSGNKIENLKTLEPLKELKNLKSLDLSNCAIASIDSYRKKVFGLLPHLKYLDGYNRDGESEEKFYIMDREKIFFEDVYVEFEEKQNCDYDEEEEDEENKYTTVVKLKKKIVPDNWIPDDRS